MRSPAPLPASFYARPVHQVARRLLGCLLVRRLGDQLLVGRVAEVEAYAGHLDPASHSYRGRTERCKTMFGPTGRAYVYFTYGNHHCVNVVAGTGKAASAVLLRAVQPTSGQEVMRRLRAAATPSERRARELLAGRADTELCSGPGKLAAAFDIGLALDGHRLTRRGALWLAPGTPARRAEWTPRIGLGSNSAAPWLWRCVDGDAAAADLSRVPAHWPRHTRPRPRLSDLGRGRAGDLSATTGRGAR